MQLANRIHKLQVSGTVKFTPLVRRLRQQGEDIIDLAVGEPLFETPAAILEATKSALDAGHTRYSDVAGLSELRSAIAQQFPGCGPEQVVISNGAKQSLFNCFQVLCNPGDQVLIPRPYWVSFTEQIRLAGAQPVLVDTAEHQLDPERLDQAIGPRTRAILVNSPNNPTGAVYRPAALAKVAELALQHGLFVVADEAYAQFVYDDEPHDSLYALEAVRDRLVVVGSFSKMFSMTGFRIGYAVAPAEVAKALTKLQGHLTGNVCTFAQYGALQALALDQTWWQERCLQLARNRDMAYAHASRLFDCIKPRGAFYLFPDVSARLEAGETSEDLAARVLTRAGVALVPGEAFGMAGHVRISFAVAQDALLRGFERMAQVL